MLDYKKLSVLASECGFTNFGPLAVDTLTFLPEVRDMCAPGMCDSYATSWSCPPGCESFDELSSLVKRYSFGIIVQTVGRLEDSFDWDTIGETAYKQNQNFFRIWNELKIDYPKLYALGNGECPLCEKCTYPDSPCRIPNRSYSSIEACGLVVSKVCASNGMSYYYGPNTIAFTGCFLLE
jgi:predicted metal-binding protein